MDSSVNVGITLDEVAKTYPGPDGGTAAVHSLSMQIPAGQLVALVGPSGCGKTTTLKMINRLIEPTSGRILLGEDDVTRVNPVQLRRRIGYVIQNVGLFPHLSVEANVATVPRLLGWDKKRQRDRAMELLELVGLEPKTFAKRYPAQLSGGQRQRVGVARALGADPPVLLMDEPFSAIDPIARTRLQDEFLRVQREVRKTIVFVTHDLDEAVRLSDRIAIFRQGGFLEQYGTPAELLGSPATPFVADFVGGQRGLRRLSVTPIEVADLEPVLALEGPEIPLSGTLQDAMAALLTDDSGHVRVVDESGASLGMLTVAGVHAALRRSIHQAEGAPTPSPVVE
ncbi:MAG TPA: ABC transporter ATP-binding protein [Frankiaceae bacterium]|nr:ABC transporter ATP-binding protein [Frankiaceae bacterium]